MKHDIEILNFYIDFDETIIHGHYFDKIFSKENYTKEEFIETFYCGVNYEEKKKIYDSIINQFNIIKKLGHKIYILSLNIYPGFKKNISNFFGPFVDNIFIQEDIKKYTNDASIMEIKQKLNITKYKYFDLNYMAILKILFIKNHCKNNHFCLIDDDENICDKSSKYFYDENSNDKLPIIKKKEKKEDLDIVLQKIIESTTYISNKKISSYKKIYYKLKSLQLSSSSIKLNENKIYLKTNT